MVEDNCVDDTEGDCEVVVDEAEDVVKVNDGVVVVEEVESDSIRFQTPRQEVNNYTQHAEFAFSRGSD